MAGIKDVAKRAGVGISTVSHVINGTKRVSPETTEKVNKAIKELDYHVDVVARSMKSSITKRIGIVISDMCGLFFPYVAKAVYEIADKYGYSLTIYDSGCKIEQERRSIQDLVHNRADGIILSSVISMENEIEYAKNLLEITNAGKKIPVVSIERNFAPYGIDSICTDMKLGACKAMQYLIDIGCRRIAHISEPFSFSGRQDAYMTVLEENNLPQDRRFIRKGDFTHTSGYHCMKDILSQGIHLDALFAANDQMALGACRAIKEYGLRIPEDIKVIGFDDVFVSNILEPPLSTIRIEKKKLGYEAIKTLLYRMGLNIDIPFEKDLSQEPRCLHLENRLIIRKSTDINAPEESGYSLHDW